MLPNEKTSGLSALDLLFSPTGLNPHRFVEEMRVLSKLYDWLNATALRTPVNTRDQHGFSILADPDNRTHINDQFHSPLNKAGFFEH